MKSLYLILILICCLGCGVFAQVPLMNSNASSTSTIFLDFDGQTVKHYLWRNDTSFVCAPSGLSNTQITEVFNRVSEDYRPFNINVTTDSTKFLSTLATKRTRIIVTPTSSWYPGVGGVAYIGSFTWGDNTPGFVFSDKLYYNPKYIGECSSHESGHTLGLDHQSRYNSSCGLTETYNSGVGSSEQTAWAPVMGNSYGKNMTGWNVGPTPYGCTTSEDNLNIIATSNGFSYRTDDFGNTVAINSTELSANNFAVDGIISTTSDKDVMKFSVTTNTNFKIDVLPFRLDATNNGANLDAKVEIYNGNRTLINTYNPPTTMNVSIDTTLNTGTYYLSISGVGNNFAPQYGSLGSYRVSGASLTVLPIRDIALTGQVSAGQHQLSWNIVSEDAISSQDIEVSSDGTTFNFLTAPATTVRSYSYKPLLTGTLYYRLKATSVHAQVFYSNVLTLKSNQKPRNLRVSTFVQQQITVQTAESFSYVLTDANGRTIKTGRGAQGSTFIDISNSPAGIYILQMVTPSGDFTERIVKQ